MELILDCRNSMEQLHAQLAQALRFPDWYGNNLDALHDCLSAVSQEIQIILTEPERLPLLVRVLHDCASDNPNIHIK